MRVVFLYIVNITTIITIMPVIFDTLFISFCDALKITQQRFVHSSLVVPVNHRSCCVCRWSPRKEVYNNGLYTSAGSSSSRSRIVSSLENTKILQCYHISPRNIAELRYQCPLNSTVATSFHTSVPCNGS